ncbi:hypothetical protein BTO20_37070 (plasmid) [Mycobacterium dioxanotrophicus]|uniref:FtsK domain-containing protein n=1 Tax=Mycobacterium dioxanotrophicus TaxID=482462 RepID=A0A1Y0CG43_9MYCO|nr:FtsK/SpoIIIE domain-containing protein [Mycobacterium dioxanotrophicus]ART74259.1 hypothetical protein BTO20_37070 [Mycobacterium dioxanotrophicus]
MTDSARLKKLARQYMQAHPGVRYQQALAAVQATLSSTAGAPTEREWLRLVGGVPSAEALATRWSNTLASHHLRWPIGVQLIPGDEPEAVWVDLVQRALGGDGVHLGLVGWGPDTGAVLQTMVTSLAAWHGPERLQFALADSTDGGTLAAVTKFPHLAFTAQNVRQDRPNAAALVDFLQQEMSRRHHLLGLTHCMDVYDYRSQAAEDGAAPLPDLLIILTDVDRLMDEHPAVAEVIEAVGRTGRALGMRLVVTVDSAPAQPDSRGLSRIVGQIDPWLLGPTGSGWPLSPGALSSLDMLGPGAGCLATAHGGDDDGQGLTPVRVFPKMKSEETRGLWRRIESMSAAAPPSPAAPGQERV